MPGKLIQATIPMCPKCGESYIDWSPCAKCGFETAYPDYGYYAPDVDDEVVDVANAANTLLKCWQDGTFTEMWMSHMNTLRKALTALENSHETKANHLEDR